MADNRLLSPSAVVVSAPHLILSSVYGCSHSTGPTRLWYASVWSFILQQEQAAGSGSSKQRHDPVNTLRSQTNMSQQPAKELISTTTASGAANKHLTPTAGKPNNHVALINHLPVRTRPCARPR
jgi:hypothetical protein